MAGDSEYEVEQRRLPYIYEGTVVERDIARHRVRLRVPGLVEPKSPWAYPAGSMFGSVAGQGSGGVPPAGANVYVFFLNGDPDSPRWFGGHWTETEIPAELKGREGYIWASETFAVVVDQGDPETGEGQRLRLLCRTPGRELSVELNHDDNTVEIDAKTGVIIKAIGAIEIDAASITIGGRKLVQNGEPIN